MSGPKVYGILLLLIAGLGGFLYGYDVGIIGAALLYLDKTIELSASRESLIVAAVLLGGTASSLVAGYLADLIGRKKVMIASALIFAVSVGLIVGAHGFMGLFSGRVFQGLSAGMIAVVIPLYLAECLPAGFRGRGTAVFQLLLTIGIFTANSVGSHYANQVEAVTKTAAAGPLLAAQDHAWRLMFLSAVYPGLLFLAGTLFITESPRWLFRRGLRDRALSALQRSRTPDQARLEFDEMSASEGAKPSPSAGLAQPSHAPDSLFQRRYVLPFLLACAVLALNQTTGINSVLQYVAVILKKAGLGDAAAAGGGAYVTAINVVFTVAGLILVDWLGRKVLLMIGTSGIILSFAGAAVIFFRVGAHPAMAGPATGHAVMACLMLFLASFAIGPGVCVWLALSELMPTRIRSMGMGIGLLINQGISSVIAASFLPFVDRFGYAPMFVIWAAFTVLYFLLAALALPETKGRTLEEIEAFFAEKSTPQGPARSGL